MIKNSFGCTVNDVVLAICAAALRSWLEARGELPAQPLAGMIPISVRTPEQMGTFGNRVSVMIAELPTNVADPVQRLLRVSQTMKAAKEHHRALPASLMQDATYPACPVRAGGPRDITVGRRTRYRLLNGTRYGVHRVTVGEDEKWGRVRRHGEHDQRLPRNGRRPGVGSVFTVTVADGGDRLAQSRFRTVLYQHDLAPSPAKT